MARAPQTELAVLGALSAGPATGYGVREAIAQVLGHFWHESFGQIYPTLAALEAARRVARTADGRFRITAAGRRRLTALLSSPVEAARPRNGLLLRLFFAASLPPGAAKALISRARDEAEAALARYAAVERALRAETNPARADWLVTVRYGLHHARATLAWANEALADRAMTGRSDRASGAVGRSGAPRPVSRAGARRGTSRPPRASRAR